MQHVNRKNIIMLAQRIKKLRKKTSYSLNKLVLSKGGITTATLSRIENGKVDVKFSTLIKVASVLGVKIDELLSDIDFDYSFEEE